MSMYPDQRTFDYGYADTGERTKLLVSFFHQVYLWMSIGLMWTACVSWACAHVPALRGLMSPGVMLVAALGAFALSIVTNRIALRSPLGVGLALFIAYATLIGFMLGPIWTVYPINTISLAFVLTGGIFAIMSLVGFVLKMDVTKIQSVLVMIVIGLFIGSIVNFWIASNTYSWLVTYAVVIIFPILIATETKTLKDFALASGDNGVLASRMAVVGALTLYISFINIFISLLRILGDRR